MHVCAWGGGGGREGRLQGVDGGHVASSWVGCDPVCFALCVRGRVQVRVNWLVGRRCCELTVCART